MVLFPLYSESLGRNLEKVREEKNIKTLEEKRKKSGKCVKSIKAKIGFSLSFKREE